MTMIEYKAPWNATGEFAGNLVKELEREVCEGHPLWNKGTRAIAQRTDSDDVLFEVESGASYAVVHLTWSGEPETDTDWPACRLFESIKDWQERCMAVDHAEYFS